MSARLPVKVIFLVSLLTVSGLCGTGLSSSAEAAEIAILKSADIAAYNQAIVGFKASVGATHAFTNYDMQGDVAVGRKLARKIRASDAALVFAVGLKAALAAKLEIVDMPVIYCMVLAPEKYDLKAPNLAGIALEVPVERQLSMIRSVLPKARKLGILYDPEKTGSFVEEVKRPTRERGFELNEGLVRSEKEVPAALRALLPKIEALWLVPDNTVLTEESLGFLLGTALDASIPTIGFSSEFVRGGALLALFVSYQDVGRQAGQLAARILGGQASLAPGILAPERVRLAINQKTAKFLGVTIPPDILTSADEVY